MILVNLSAYWEPLPALLIMINGNLWIPYTTLAEHLSEHRFPSWLLPGLAWQVGTRLPFQSM